MLAIEAARSLKYLTSKSSLSSNKTCPFQRTPSDSNLMLATSLITAAESCTAGLDHAVVLNKEPLSTTAERKSAICTEAQQMTSTWSKFLIQDTDGSSEHGQSSSGYMHKDYRRSLATLLAPNRLP